jgi:hypothetical protein
LFVSWIDYHGRSAALAAQLQLTPVFVQSRFRNTALRYIDMFLGTIRLIRRAQPGTVVVMLPPLPALLAVLLAAPRRARILADLHTGVFLNDRWRWALRPTLFSLRRHAAIVTNDELVAWCNKAGVRAFPLHDPLAAPLKSGPQCAQEQILVPLSYANDEPIEALLEAVRDAPELTFVLTGRAPADVRVKAPVNVRFSGYVPQSDYTRMVREARAVIALTNRNLTMQRAGYEALELGVPVITSDFAVLRSFFEDAAMYTEPTVDALRETLQAFTGREAELRAASPDVLRRRIREQELQMMAIHDYIGDRIGGDAV